MPSNRTLFIIGLAVLVVLLLRIDYSIMNLANEVAETGEQVGEARQELAEVKQELDEREDEKYRELIDTHQHVKYSKADLQCMAKNIYYEAGTESTAGKYAVATVTLNRLKTHYWGRNTCKVVYAKAQFSWTAMRVPKPDKKLWAESVQIAKRSFDGVRVKGLMHSLYYHADYIETPEWVDQSKRITKIGAHIFYTKAKFSWVKI